MVLWGGVVIRVFPVVPPEGGHVWFDDWHEARRGEFRHEAQDIFAPRGSVVVAPEAGIVTGVATTPKGGRTVHLRARQADGSVRRYYFAHLEEHLVEKGARVAPGMALGTVGNSGNAQRTRPHLHLQVTRWRDGRKLYAENVYEELRELAPGRRPGKPPDGAVPLGGAGRGQRAPAGMDKRDDNDDNRDG